MFQLIVGLAILALVGIYVWLRRSQHSEANLPAVSEDVNLPMPTPPTDAKDNKPQQ